MISIHKLWIALIVFVSFVNLTSGDGRIIYVDEDATGVTDGTSWQNAYNYLFDALKDAYFGDKPSEIHIAEGTYKPDEGDGRNQGDPNLFFLLLSDVTIKGGYAGFGEPNQDDQDYNRYRTVLSGDLADNDNETDTPDHLLDSSRRNDNSYNVVLANFETQGAVLDGLIVSGGNASDPNSEGAGLLNKKGSIRVINCTFINNAVQGWGGGMATLEGDTTLIHCIFSNNYASYTGGGADAYKSMIALTNCTFKDNIAGQAGGGMSINNTHMKMSDSVLISNTTLIAAGGLYNSLSSDVEIIGCSFRNNHVIDGGGGGIYNDECNPTLINCCFIGNRAGSINNSPESNYILDPPTTHLDRRYGTDGGGIFNYKSSPELMNCTFSGNVAGNAGGGMFNIGSTHIDDNTYCQPELTNCTFLSNFACSGGHIFNGVYQDRPTLTNCVVYKNVSLRNDTGYSVGSSGTRTTYSFIQGEGPDADNVNQDPRLTPDGHLLNDSMLINEGEPGFVSQWTIDRDNEPRIIGGRVDLGADEFQDTDKDGFADAWQVEYFNDLIFIEPEKDEDHDGITNLDEYEIYGSDPNSAPVYVDAQKGSDLNGGYTKDIEDDTHGPKRSIQAGIDTISDGGTVLVAPGNYTGIGNYELDFSAKTIIVRSLNGPDNTIIDCRGQGRAINFEASKGAFGVLDGFTIIHGDGDIGGGAHLESTQFFFNDCVIKDCSADVANGLYAAFSNLRINNLSVFNNIVDAWNRNLGIISFSNVNLAGPFELGRGRTDIISSWFDGPGILGLSEGSLILITGYEGGGASVFRTDIKGPGHIEIEGGQQLIIEGKAIVNLSRAGGIGLPDPEKDGQILVNGSLVLRGMATLESTNVEVKVLDVNTPNDIQYNNITLLEASTGFGGEFFVAENVKIQYNNIVSEGDRYLDLDPDPSSLERPTITNNVIMVIIKEGSLGNQGTLLELRAADYDFGGSYNPNSTSGAYKVDPISMGFTEDPSKNWVLGACRRTSFLAVIRSSCRIINECLQLSDIAA
ncbi:hypothetical protein ACFL3Q_05810 [Planctomycetota bacterium]